MGSGRPRWDGRFLGWGQRGAGWSLAGVGVGVHNNNNGNKWSAWRLHMALIWSHLSQAERTCLVPRARL